MQRLLKLFFAYGKSTQKLILFSISKWKGYSKAYTILYLQRQSSKAVQKAVQKFSSKITCDWSLQEKRTTIKLFIL
jgi:hypothetical protein